MKDPRPDTDLEGREPMRIAFAVLALLLGLAATVGASDPGPAGAPAAAAAQ
ncbi:MAG TPA: hypothetical protein VMR06_15455 [Dokdonella sp.]|uniref:hypothetical protein n=1 Tax=Dokdonella sp. TaxID=2291710 RepID=UPI002C168BFA|nr:hypothetical protein [Dokdonella sp.]HUD43389.1 hypothetical protein [Dokdonella sp.]